MNRQLTRSTLVAIGILALSGCAGYDRILFATKTNVGLDIDDQPTTAEITIARRELAITPAFQHATSDENTLPLLASFGLKGNFLNPEITSRFAGGEAAVILAQGPQPSNSTPPAGGKAAVMLVQGPKQPPGSTPQSQSSSLCLSEKPDTRTLLKKIWHFLTAQKKEQVKEDTRAFYFATDTTFGLKAAWDGATGPYPSTVKLGYNRRELAFPPVFATPDSACNTPDTPQNSTGSRVTVPSFVASLDNSSTITDIKEWVTGEDRAKGAEWAKSGVTQIQFFATGKAASEFVKRPEVNRAMNEKMYPHVAVATPTVNPPLSVTPSSQIVPHGQSFQFGATGGVAPLRFTISDNHSGGSMLDEKLGRYKAGNASGKTDRVTVIDSSSPPKSVEVTVNVQ